LRGAVPPWLQNAGMGIEHRPSRAALVLRDNWRHRNHIERAYRQAIGAARSEILMAHAYFLPSRKVLRALELARARGVRVRLLLQGRYEYFLQFHAVSALYGRLLRAGIEIHTYQPSFLHAKVAVVDDHWATVGSSNMDPLSLLLAREANVVERDAAFAQDLRQSLEVALEDQSVQVQTHVYVNRPFWVRFLDASALLLVRLMLLLTGRRY